MIKKLGIRKLSVSLMSLLLIGLIYLFPTKDEVILNTTITYVDENKLSEVFLLDKNNYLAEVSVIITSDSFEDRLKEKLMLLISGENLPNNFKSLLPSNTKVNSLKVINNICEVDFSKELLSMSELYEEKAIEEIVYTLTSEEDISKVIIKVEGKVLERLPHSNKILPNVLDRTYGINKEYDINNIYDLTKTTVYYLAKDNDLEYYVPVTTVSNDKTEKIMIIVNELKSSPLYQSNLNSYLNNKAVLKKYEMDEAVINLTFNDKIFDSIYNQNILEEVVYTIGKSVKDNYNVKKVNFYVDDKEITSF